MGLLERKVAVVTGAGHGIGRAHALELARQGASVVVNDLGSSVRGTGSGRDADETVALIGKSGGVAAANYCDVSDHEQCGQLVNQAIDTWGRIDILVNNAGIVRDSAIWNMQPEDFDAVMAVHVRGTWSCCHRRGRPLEESGQVGRGGGGSYHQHHIGRRAHGELRAEQLRHGESSCGRADLDPLAGTSPVRRHGKRGRSLWRDTAHWHDAGCSRGHRAGRGASRRVAPHGSCQQLAAGCVAGQRRFPARHRAGPALHPRSGHLDSRWREGAEIAAERSDGTPPNWVESWPPTYFARLHPACVSCSAVMAEPLARLIAPGRSALLLQEIQEGVVGPVAALGELAAAAAEVGLVGRASHVAERARLVGVPVLHCTAAELGAGFGRSRNARLFAAARRLGTIAEADHSSVAPASGLWQEGDLVLPRYHGLSPLTGSQLDSILRNEGITTVVIAGLSLNVAIPNLVFDAINRSYQVVVVRDAVVGSHSGTATRCWNTPSGPLPRWQRAPKWPRHGRAPHPDRQVKSEPPSMLMSAPVT